MTQFCPFCNLVIAAGDRQTVNVGVVKAHEGCLKNHIEKPQHVRLKQIVKERIPRYG